MRAAAAGGLYALTVFAAGFVFGIVRVLAISPVVGETVAILLELPLILAIAWAICAVLARSLAVPRHWLPRLVMGSVAFAVVILADSVVGIVLQGGNLKAVLAHYTSAPGLAGLAGQAVFAAIPLLQAVTVARRARD